MVAAHGRHYQVATDDGRLVLAYRRGKRSDLACGDRISLELSAPDQGAITGVAPRRSLLYRSDQFRRKLIAANATQIIVVVATTPSFHDEMISRCLLTAEQQALNALIILNKADLADKLAPARASLEPFARAGYSIVELSALADAEELRPRLLGRLSVLIGQSGMGKSTLIRALVPGAAVATREISTFLDSGKHTTTVSQLYRLDPTSALIDSPGLQEFGVSHLTREQIENGFPEFRPHLGHCRFRDCRHHAEPGCALTAAATTGELSATRIGHFRRIAAEAGARR